jgi:hypothetical protein
MNIRSDRKGVLVVGEWQWPWYQEACSAALVSLSCQVFGFGWTERFKRWVPGGSEPVFCSLWFRARSRAESGPAVRQLRRDLLRMAARGRSIVVFFYNVQLIALATVGAQMSSGWPARA